MILGRQQITERYIGDIWPVIFPAAALVGADRGLDARPPGRDFRAFLCSSAMIALLIISGAIGMYPNLLISTTDPAYNLTITNAAAADNTLHGRARDRAHRHALRAALHDRRLLHLPRQGDGRAEGY